MRQMQQQIRVSDGHAFVWIDLTKEPSSSVAHSIAGEFEFRTVREPQHIVGAIEHCAPPFICVELAEESGGEAGPKSIDMLKRVSETCPDLPALIVVGHGSSMAALCAIRLRVWNVIIKPVSATELHRTIRAMVATFQPGGSREAWPAVAGKADERPGIVRTSSAISYVASHYMGRITINDVAAQCRLSPSQFCRTFKKEHHVSFGRYLLRYRMDRARERLSLADVLVGEVAFEVGFNDLSYFTRSFRREFGLCPTEFQAGAIRQQASPMPA
jgi:AraC-like DNA-binding protein